VRQAAATFLATMLRHLLAFACGVVIARFLGPEGKGEWTALVLLPSILHMASTAGLPTAHVVLGSRLRFPLSHLWANGLLHAGVGGVLALALGFGLVRLGPGLLEGLEVRPDLLPWILPAVALILLKDHARGLLQSQRLILSANVLELLHQAALLVGALTALILGRGLAGLVVSYWAALVLYQLAAQPLVRLMRAGEPSRPSGEAFRAAARLGVIAWASDFVQWLHYRVDVLLLMVFHGAREVGFYSVGVALGEGVWLLSHSIQFVLLPALGEAGPEDRMRRVERASRFGLWVGIAGGCGAALLVWPIVRYIFGVEFLPSVAIVWVLLPGAVLLGVARAFSALHLAMERPQINLRISAAALVVNLVLNFLWIPTLGPLGAALSTTISYTLMYVVFLLLHRRMFGSSWRSLLWVGREDRAYLRDVLGWKRR
jgi:O-antigen/teichoic acid export membrane protein